jgi:hypothetical protein
MRRTSNRRSHISIERGIDIVASNAIGDIGLSTMSN